MNSFPLISIIIPCYNNALYIEKCVHSALKQTYLNKEVIVVDDGSNEETKAVLSKIEPLLTKLITQENQGQSVARNVGICEANGKYILNLDSDDFFEPTFCEKAVKKFEEDNEIKIVTCHCNRFNVSGYIDVYAPSGGDLQSFLFANGALGSSMFKKSDWETCGGYDESIKEGFEDWEFYIRLLQMGGFAHVLNEPLFNYRQHKESTSHRIRNERLKKFKQIIKKHNNLYISNFESLVDDLFNKLEKEAIEKNKNNQRLEFRIGKSVLKPIRWIKSLFR